MLERDQNGILHVIALSGGKDSTCLAELLIEQEPRPYNLVCTPTGDELPEMFDHWRRLSERFQKPIIPIMAGTLKSVIKQQNCLPNFRIRFCTRIIKIEPFRQWLRQQAAKGPITSYVGLRADEEGRAGGAYSDIEGVNIRFPLREWEMDKAAVWAELEQRNIQIPRRTDCARCYHQTLGEWWLLWREHRDIFDDAIQDEENLGQTYRTPGRDTWPTALRDLAEEFAKGRIPTRGFDPRQDDIFRAGACRVCSL